MRKHQTAMGITAPSGRTSTLTPCPLSPSGRELYRLRSLRASSSRTSTQPAAKTGYAGPLPGYDVNRAHTGCKSVAPTHLKRAHHDELDAHRQSLHRKGEMPAAPNALCEAAAKTATMPKHIRINAWPPCDRESYRTRNGRTAHQSWKRRSRQSEPL